MRNIRAVLLDCDGTLVNTLESLQYSMNQAMESFHLDPITIEQTKTFVGNGGRVFVKRSVEATADRYYREAEKYEEKEPDRAFELDQQGDDVMAKLEEVTAKYFNIFKDGCTYLVKAYPGMPESLKLFRQQGLKLACVTNKSLNEAVRVLDKVYGENFFDYISADDGTHPLKPDTGVIRDVLEHLDVRAEECVYVGDTRTDMLTAYNSGIPSVGCLYGFRSKEELVENHATVLIGNASELPAAVEKIRKL